MTQNQIRYAEYLETQRSNKAKESEQQRYNTLVTDENLRHNLASESVSAIQAAASQQQAAASSAQAATAAARASEEVRHNLAMEPSQTGLWDAQASKAATESENIQSNMPGGAAYTIARAEKGRELAVKEQYNTILNTQTTLKGVEVGSQQAANWAKIGISLAGAAANAAGSIPVG